MEMVFCRDCMIFLEAIEYLSVLCVQRTYTYSKQNTYNFVSFGARKSLGQNGVEFPDKFIKILKSYKTQELCTLYALYLFSTENIETSE